MSSMPQDNGQKVKGYLFNLIVFTKNEGRANTLSEIVRPFIEKFPSRTLFISCQEEMPEKQIATATIPEGQDEESSDHFLITSPPSLLERIPFAILPKLVPDLPVYLVWGGNPTAKNQVLTELERWASRLVFDGGYAENLKEFSQLMLEKITHLKIDFMDIGWARIGGWRKVLAQVFNSAEKIDTLNRSNTIVIKYNRLENGAAGHPSVQAIYLQAWLASQLGWKPRGKRSDDPLTLEYQLPRGSLKVELVPQERSTLTQGRIFEIEFRTEDQLTTMLTLAEKQSKVMVYVSTPEKCNLPLSYAMLDISKGLTAMKEVFYHPPSEHYRKMLTLLANMEL